MNRIQILPLLAVLCLSSTAGARPPESGEHGGSGPIHPNTKQAAEKALKGIGATAPEGLKVHPAGDNAEESTVMVMALSGVLQRRAIAHKAFSADKQMFAGSYLDGWEEVISIHDAKSGKQIKRIFGHGDEVRELKFTPDGTLLASRCINSSRKGWALWDVSTGKLILRLPVPRSDEVDPSTSGPVHPNTEEAARKALEKIGANAPEGLRVHPAAPKKAAKVDPSTSGPVHPNTEEAATKALERIGANAPEGLRVHPAAPKKATKVDPSTSGPVHPDTEEAVLDELEEQEGDARSKKIDHKPEEDTVLLEAFSGVLQRKVLAHKAFSADRQVFAGSYRDGWEEVISIHDAKSGKQIKRIFGHGDEIRELKFTPDGKILASRCINSSRKGWALWDVSTGKLILRLPVPRSDEVDPSTSGPVHPNTEEAATKALERIGANAPEGLRVQPVVPKKATKVDPSTSGPVHLDTEEAAKKALRAAGGDAPGGPKVSPGNKK